MHLHIRGSGFAGPGFAAPRVTIAAVGSDEAHDLPFRLVSDTEIIVHLATVDRLWVGRDVAIIITTPHGTVAWPVLLTGDAPGSREHTRQARSLHARVPRSR